MDEYVTWEGILDNVGKQIAGCKKNGYPTTTEMGCRDFCKKCIWNAKRTAAD